MLPGIGKIGFGVVQEGFGLGKIGFVLVQGGFGLGKILAGQGKIGFFRKQRIIMVCNKSSSVFVVAQFFVVAQLVEHYL